MLLSSIKVLWMEWSWWCSTRNSQLICQWSYNNKEETLYHRSLGSRYFLKFSLLYRPLFYNYEYMKPIRDRGAVSKNQKESHNPWYWNSYTSNCTIRKYTFINMSRWFKYFSKSSGRRLSAPAYNSKTF